MPLPLLFEGDNMKRWMGVALLASLACFGHAQTASPDAIASRVDSHYNHLASFRADYTERYTGLGMNREEHGTLLLKKPGRMRWNYSDGKLFVLDGKSAVSYTPGDPQAQRIPAKELDDLRSPLRFLLGHTKLQKELDHLTAAPGPDGTVVLSGTPHAELGAEGSRVQRIAVTVTPDTGSIRGLRVEQADGSVTEFHFSDVQENVPTPDSAFRFVPPPGVVVVNGQPPA